MIHRLLARSHRLVLTAIGLLVLWYLVTRLTSIPAFMLPGPISVAQTLFAKRQLLFENTLTTLTEIVTGLIGGTLLGCLSALLMVLSREIRRWLMPLLVISQALPVFALAPLLVLWFGFGMASKEVMAILIIYFPVTAAFFDGLQRTEPGWLDLARTMHAGKLGTIRHVRLPAALPGFASGLRVATAVAPIGAIIGEWVGSSAGLGYVMLTANAQLQTDTMFAALLVLAVIAISLWYGVDAGLRRLLYWMPEGIAPG
jgi:putative hydroxymethylpyrimidine transport system permease protein